MDIWLCIKTWFLGLMAFFSPQQQEASNNHKENEVKQIVVASSTQISFIDSIKTYTKPNYDWRLVYAVGKLESRNGKSTLSKSIHNYFNVTATKKQRHKEVVVDGKTFRFVIYNSMAHSISAFQYYLENKKGEHWENALKALEMPSNPRKFFESLRKAGYADDSYPIETLLNIYNEASE